jgi:hypothetical protein
MASEAGADPLFELVVYLVSCARLSLEEPVIYGSFRLIEAASRIVAALDPDQSDPFLARQRSLIEANKLLMIDHQAEYRSWLDDLLRNIVAEAKRRA